MRTEPTIFRMLKGFACFGYNCIVFLWFVLFEDQPGILSPGKPKIAIVIFPLGQSINSCLCCKKGQASPGSKDAPFSYFGTISGFKYGALRSINAWCPIFIPLGKSAQVVLIPLWAIIANAIAVIAKAIIFINLGIVTS